MEKQNKLVAIDEERLEELLKKEKELQRLKDNSREKTWLEEKNIEIRGGQ